MSNTTYVVKPGDQLLFIAVEQGVDYNELLKLNRPLQANPNLIIPGQIITLPSKNVDDEEDNDENVMEPVNPSINVSQEGQVSCKPACKGIELVDILMETGDHPGTYYLLDESAQKEVLNEAKIMADFAAEYQDFVMHAPDASSTPQSELDKYQQTKQKWFNKGANGGVFNAAEIKKSNNLDAAKIKESNDTKIKSKITDLKKKRDLLERYYNANEESGSFPYFFTSTQDSMKTLWKELVKPIDAEINLLNHLLSAPKKLGASNARAIKQENFTKKSAARSPVNEYGMVEVLLVSQARLIYLRADFITTRKGQWKTSKSSGDVTKALKSGKGIKEISSAIFNDIKKGIASDAAKSKLGELSSTWYTNKLADLKLKEWKFTTEDLKDSTETSVFAVNREAQLLRFCAHVDVKSTLNPKEGDVNLSISTGVEASLLEGKVTTNCYLPHNKGELVSIVYKDANKKDTVYSFGRFRFNGRLTLSCFVGATASGSATAATQSKKPAPSGLQAIASPNVKMKVLEGAGVSVSGSAFAGAQAGGAVEGMLEWESPDNDSSNSFGILAQIKAEGSFAIGAGIGGDIKLTLEGGEFVFYCKGTLVWGPGGSGGFGTTVNAKNIWELAKVILGGLQVADYRSIECIDGDAYRYLAKAAYFLFVSDVADLEAAINSGMGELDDWWDSRMDDLDDRTQKKEEAQRIAHKVIFGGDIYSKMKLNHLPPETVGMLLDTLVCTFYFSFERSQEIAITHLLKKSVGKSWRKLEEILAHMTPTGVKVDGEEALFKNLARLNAILDNGQQIRFNKWIKWVAEGADHFDEEAEPFITTPDQKTFEHKLAKIKPTLDKIEGVYT